MKSRFAFPAIAAILSSCSVTGTMPERQEDTFLALVERTVSRTVLGEQDADGMFPVLWEDDDSILIFGEDGHGSIYTMDGTPSDQARFIYDGHSEGNSRPAVSESYTALYPASACTSRDASSVTIPHTQSYRDACMDRNAFLMSAGPSSDRKLNFSCCCGIIRLVIKSEEDMNVKEIRAGANQDMSGNIARFTDGKLEWVKRAADTQHLGNVAVLDCPDGTTAGAAGKAFLIAVPPDSYTNLAFQIKKAGNGYAVYRIPGKISVGRGEMVTFDIHEDAFFSRSGPAIESGADFPALTGLEYTLDCGSDAVTTEAGKTGKLTLASYKTATSGDGSIEEEPCGWTVSFSTDGAQTFSSAVPPLFSGFTTRGSGSLSGEEISFVTAADVDGSCTVRITQQASGKHQDMLFTVG